MSHTKGPWFVERERDMQPGTICDLGCGEDGRPWLVCSSSDDCSADEVLEANANLLAAAPDLLRAAAAFLTSIASCYRGAGLIVPGPVADRLADQFKAAVAKAGGVQA